MHWSTLGPRDVIFTHIDTDDEHTIRTFAITRLMADPEFNILPVVCVEIDPSFAMWSLQGRGIEPHRLMKLRGVQVVEPVIFAHMPDGTHLLIDGSHRFVARYLDKHDSIKARLVPESIWSKYLVEGVQELGEITHDNLQNSRSGL